MGETLHEVMTVFAGSDAEATHALYGELDAVGPAGQVATCSLRAQKASARAKVYRGGNDRGSFSRQAYDRKTWSLEQLVKVLTEHGAALGLRWGWGLDAKQPVHRHVLYVDLPVGQVSWHADARGQGPDYPGEWDGVAGAADGRVCSYAARLLAQHQAEWGDL